MTKLGSAVVDLPVLSRVHSGKLAIWTLKPKFPILCNPKLSISNMDFDGEKMEIPSGYQERGGGNYISGADNDGIRG